MSSTGKFSCLVMTSLTRSLIMTHVFVMHVDVTWGVIASVCAQQLQLTHKLVVHKEFTSNGDLKNSAVSLISIHNWGGYNIPFIVSKLLLHFLAKQTITETRKNALRFIELLGFYLIWTFFISAIQCNTCQEYKSCGTTNPKTCRNMCDKELDLPIKCVEGCFCPNGTLYHNGKCVEPASCPCYVDGKEYPPGEVPFLKNCQKWWIDLLFYVVIFNSLISSRYKFYGLISL